MKVAKNLGLIRVSVYQTIFKSKDRLKNSSRHGLKTGAGGLSLAEKALKGKAVSHGTA